LLMQLKTLWKIPRQNLPVISLIAASFLQVVEPCLQNIDILIREETGLPITITDDPLSAVARGAGMALDQLNVLKDYCSSNIKNIRSIIQSILTSFDAALVESPPAGSRSLPIIMRPSFINKVHNLIT